MRRQSQVWVTIALMCLVAGAANAADMKWGGEVFGALSTHSMSDLNKEFDAANSAGASFSKISTGFGGGVNLRMRVKDNWMFTAGWEPIFANT